ncbi:alpha/beta fold hydrolase [Litorisediminicola beolgyonensis]|uniref:Alpha/beta fold hydrolase n=1 Tax=Litorisediminicola beolgyonensis TaxID=1173614 RepID=A0ABW3ZMW5_9RHOB
MYVTVNGARLFFDVDGEALTPVGGEMRQKPTVVMVHGGPGADHSVSKPFFSQLTDIAQVVYYDHRGNGRSDLCDPETWTLAQWGDDLKGLCDALGIEKPIVIGTSFGGFVTLSYATRHPGHAAGLVLISTAAHVDFSEVYAAYGRRGGPEIEEIARNYWDAPSDAGRALYRDRCVPLYTVRRDLGTEWLSRIVWRNETALWFNGPGNEHGRMEMRPDLGRVTAPALVMVGKDDPITPPVFSDALARGLAVPPERYLTLDRCGHGVVADRPEAALAAIRAFIAEVGSA